jgi:phosphate transport system protein
VASDSTRLHYQEELDSLEERALGGLDLVIETLNRTLEAVEHSDSELAEMVVADDDRIDGRYLEVHQSILALLATQAPVATDLRLISALLHLMKSVERMGDQCVNIAKVIPLAGHNPPSDQQMIDATSSARTTSSTISTSRSSIARSRSATTSRFASGRRPCCSRPGR